MAHMGGQTRCSMRWRTSNRWWLLWSCGKGSAGRTSDRSCCPIVLVSVVYRLWAAARAALMRGWLRVAGVLRERPLAAADALAGFLGLELGEAHMLGEPMVGLALDVL